MLLVNGEDISDTCPKFILKYMVENKINDDCFLVRFVERSRRMAYTVIFFKL